MCNIESGGEKIKGFSPPHWRGVQRTSFGRIDGGLATDIGCRYVIPMEIETTFVCSYCLQMNEVLVDATGGLHQEYVEDCQVCCRPNRLVITIDEAMQGARIEAEQG